MALIDHVNWSELDALVTRQQRNRSAHTPVISLFRWWARRPHSFAGALLDAARVEFGRARFLVADPFSGGGTVAFEATRRGLPIYAQDLYPWPSQGLATALTAADSNEFKRAANELLQGLRLFREAYWRTEGNNRWETTHIIRVRKAVIIAGFNIEREDLTNKPTPFGALPTIQAKLDASRAAVEKLHPGRSHLLTKPVYISWAGIPYSLGAFANNRHSECDPAYAQLEKPQGRTYFAGDYLSHLVAWQEGAVLSAHHAIERIIRQMNS